MIKQSYILVVSSANIVSHTGTLLPICPGGHYWAVSYWELAGPPAGPHTDRELMMTLLCTPGSFTTSNQKSEWAPMAGGAGLLENEVPSLIIVVYLFLFSL